MTHEGKNAFDGFQNSQSDVCISQAYQIGDSKTGLMRLDNT